MLHILSPYVFEKARVEVTMLLTTEVIPRFWSKRGGGLFRGVGTIVITSMITSKSERAPTLSEILRDKALYNEFREFLQLTSSIDQLDFIQDVIGFQDGQTWNTSHEMRWRALQLFSKWFDDRSDTRLTVVAERTIDKIKLDLFGTLRPGVSATVSPKPPSRAPPPLLPRIHLGLPSKPASQAPQRRPINAKCLVRTRSQSFDAAVAADLKKLSALLPV